MDGSISRRHKPGEEPAKDAPYRARYRVNGKQYERTFAKRKDAQAWLRAEAAKQDQGKWIEPGQRKMTVDQWCDVWLDAYASRRESTYRAAESQLRRVRQRFGTMRLEDVKALHVKAWMAELQAEGLAQGTRYGLHRRLRQLFNDAVDSGVLGANPVTPKSGPKPPKQRPYVLTTEQVQALADAIGERWAPAIWLGAEAGLRVGEVCGLRVSDVDYTRKLIHVRVQYPCKPLKTDHSAATVPITETLALRLAAHRAQYPTDWVLSNEWNQQAAPWVIERHFREAVAQVKGLPETVRFHDLRHYCGSMLMLHADVKTAQAHLRHGSAQTTLDVYGHAMPGREERSRSVFEGVSGGNVGEARAQGLHLTHLP